MSLALEELMHLHDAHHYKHLPDRVRRQWEDYVRETAVTRPPLTLKQWLIVKGYAVSYGFENGDGYTKVKQQAEPVAFMTFSRDRAITARELAAIPADKGRRENVKRMYGIDLFSEIDQVLLRRRETQTIHERTADVHLEQMVRGGWTFEYEFSTRYIVAKHENGGLQSICEVYPGWGVAIASALNRIVSTTNQRDAFVAALTPGGETKYAYLGEFKERVTMRAYDADGDEIETSWDHTISWDTIKAILAAIKMKADKDAIRRDGFDPKPEPKPVYNRWQRFCLKIARIPT